jgi:3-phenylpropionate/cinnamic acid dioxygenase small subunit
VELVATLARADGRAGMSSSDVSKPLPINSPLYNQVLAFLYREAWLLDHDLFEEWLKFLAKDLVYTAPVRVTRRRADGDRSLTGRTGFHYHDNFHTMSVRVRRILGTDSAWSDDPPVRCRRFISNVMVGECEKSDELHARSYLQVARSRFEWPNYQWITAERNDILRKQGDGFVIARREILVDLAVLGTPNLALFL